ncbi:MAG TPA: HEPN domain-containing protein [Spirochaetota bacterium]|nr:HEPN domain-containing protein [Spirochaetota bacterium]
MTDLDVLFDYRMRQARETLTDAEGMLRDGYSSRSIINRSYYVLFYSLLALYVKEEFALSTSKHAGIITIFDRDYVRTGIFDKKYSRILHMMFDLRQECDYKELSDITEEEASQAVQNAGEFFTAIEKYIESKNQ